MRQLALPVILLLIAAAGAAVLLPGVNGPFLFDDYVNIAENPAFLVDDWTWNAIREATLTNLSGLLGRPVSTLSFVANVAAFGLEPFNLKLTNIFLHGLTAVLMTLLALRLLEHARSNLGPRQRRIAALFTGLAWSVHPIAITSTLYIVQRMNLLSVLFTVAALLAYLEVRRLFFSARARAFVWAMAALLLWLCGIFSKENALLLPVYVVLIEWLILGFRDPGGRELTRWRSFVAATTVAVTLLAALLFILTWDRWEAGYSFRNFTLVERLLTESRVLWQYVAMVIFPSHGRMGLFLDDIPISTGLFSPLSTVFALLGWAGAITGAVLIRRRLPLISFGIFFFLAGHLMESTVFSLEIAFEHRNYLPSFGLLLALAAGIQQVGRRMQLPLIEVFPLAVFCIFLAGFTVIRSLHWADAYLLAQLESFHHPASPRAQAQLGNEYVSMAYRARATGNTFWTDFYYDEAVTHFKDATALDPDSRSALMAWFLNAHLLGKPFPDDAYEALLDRLRNGTPTADTPGHIDRLFRCLETDCSNIAGRVEEIIHAALDNPRVTGRLRSELMVVAAKFFRDVRNQQDWTLYWLANAAGNSPDIPRFRLFLARQLAAMGRREDALEEMERIDEMDEFGIYNRELAEISKMLDQADSSQNQRN